MMNPKRFGRQNKMLISNKIIVRPGHNAQKNLRQISVEGLDELGNLSGKMSKFPYAHRKCIIIYICIWIVHRFTERNLWYNII